MELLPKPSEADKDRYRKLVGLPNACAKVLRTRAFCAMFMIYLGHIAVMYTPEPTEASGYAAFEKRWQHIWLRQEADYWKALSEKMVKEVECVPTVGPRKYNNPEQPESYVNDPGRFWYSQG